MVENSNDVLETVEDIKQETYFADKFRTPAIAPNKPTKRDPDDIGPFGGNRQFSPYTNVLFLLILWGSCP